MNTRAPQKLAAICGLVTAVLLSTCMPAHAAADPRPGSAAAKRAQVESYRQLLATLLTYESSEQTASHDPGFEDTRELAIRSVLLGLDNLRTPAANRLVVDLAAVYLGDKASPTYSCVVQRKGRALKAALAKAPRLTEWCDKTLPSRVCLSEQHAQWLLRVDMANDVSRHRYPRCDTPLHP